MWRLVLVALMSCFLASVSAVSTLSSCDAVDILDELCNYTKICFAIPDKIESYKKLCELTKYQGRKSNKISVFNVTALQSIGTTNDTKTSNERITPNTSTKKLPKIRMMLSSTSAKPHYDKPILSTVTMKPHENRVMLPKSRTKFPDKFSTLPTTGNTPFQSITITNNTVSTVATPSPTEAAASPNVSQLIHVNNSAPSKISPPSRHGNDQQPKISPFQNTIKSIQLNNTASPQSSPSSSTATSLVTHGTHPQPRSAPFDNVIQTKQPILVNTPSPHASPAVLAETNKGEEKSLFLSTGFLSAVLGVMLSAILVLSVISIRNAIRQRSQPQRPNDVVHLLADQAM